MLNTDYQGIERYHQAEDHCCFEGVEVSDSLKHKVFNEFTKIEKYGRSKSWNDNSKTRQRD